MTDVRDQATPTMTVDQSNNQGSFIWYELLTGDIAGAKRFYDAVVGWNIQGTSNFPNDYRMIERSDGKSAGGAMQLTEEMKQHGGRPIWLAYIYSDDVDRLASDVERNDGKILMAPFDIPGIGRVAMVADPQGAPFYIMKPIPPANDRNAKSDVFSPDQPQRMSWNELSTSDPETARKFYGDLFGWNDGEFMDMGDNGKYRFLMHDGQRIGAMCGTMGGQQSKWRFYIRVPSIATAVEAVKVNGGSVTMGPHEVPGGDHIIIGNDPQGAEFALVGPR